MNFTMTLRQTIKIAAAALAIGTAVSCSGGQDKFITVKDGQFIRNGEPYYFVGANMWYGAMLASEGRNGDRERLLRELDCLDSMGVDNIRVLVGSDGQAGRELLVEPVLQTAPGVYNDTIFRGLDFLMAELAKREMTAVLYLTNSWEWSGGFGQYLEWAGFGRTPLPKEVSWKEYCEVLSRFHRSGEAMKMYEEHVKKVVSRVNTVTGLPYSQDPALFSWQICNEPRPFSAGNKEAFARWIGETAALIKSIDPNHMVSTGSEGIFGCEVDADLFEKIHSFAEVDYVNMHIWPFNWSWVREHNLDSTDVAIARTREYIDAHMEAVQRMGKPLVIEEFGYPRDGFVFEKGTPVTAKDRYYEYIFSLVEESAGRGGILAGCNFWAWGGYASQSPVNLYWKPGDDYCGDPAQEQQGLYSVYASDTTTVQIIRDAAQRLGR